MIDMGNKYEYSIYNIPITQDEHTVTLYNCYSGGIVQLEKDVFDSIKDKDFLLDDVKYGNELKNNGYIVNNQIDEFRRAKMQIETTIANHMQKAVSYVIAPTLNCNLRCVYCFQKDFRTDGKENIITKETSEKIIEYILKSNQSNKYLKQVNITWFGGEPLLCFEQIVSFCKDIKDRLSEINVKLMSKMITNGALLDDDKLKILKSECNLEQVQITLDGEVDTYCEKKQTTAETFGKVLKNIKNATKHIKTNVRVNADKTNYEELKSVIKSLYESDINKENLIVHFAQLRDYSCNEKESACFNDLEFWESKEKFFSDVGQIQSSQKNNSLTAFSHIPYCGLAIGKNLVIDYLGNFYKCEHYIGDKSKIVGNVDDGLFYNKTYMNATKLATDVRCEKCKVFPFCNYAQCVAMHSFSGTDENCKCYEKQLETIQQKVKKYLETHKNENS